MTDRVLSTSLVSRSILAHLAKRPSKAEFGISPSRSEGATSSDGVASEAVLPFHLQRPSLSLDLALSRYRDLNLERSLISKNNALVEVAAWQDWK